MFTTSFSLCFFAFPHEHAETLKEKGEEVLAVGSAVVNPDVNPIAGTFMLTDIVRTDIMRTVISCGLHFFSLLADTALHCTVYDLHCSALHPH
jgi:hypothetical protein